MINNVVLVGRLTQDPELRQTSNMINVLQVPIAVNRNFTNNNNEREADFINIVAWRKTAELISQYTKKGSLIGVEGRIQTRRYEDKDGNPRVAFEVLANQITFLETKSQSQENQTKNFSKESTETKEEKNNQEDLDINFDDITEDDLPF